MDIDQAALLARNVEPDTHILETQFMRVNGIPLLFETWSWDGILGHSAVLLNEHVERMEDATLLRFLREEAKLDVPGSLTITRRALHTFVNFGFPRSEPCDRQSRFGPPIRGTFIR